MVVQIVVQAWHVPLLSAGAIDVDGKVPLIAICTGGDIKWIPASELFGNATEDSGSETAPTESSDQEETPPKSNPFFCPICIGLAVTILSAAVIGLALLAPARRFGTVRNGVAVVSALSIHATAPRGPPIAA